ncbi:Smr/MutS family protein [Pigmentibacter sp. JX0631]|uniref:endonuclease MutS2 n=1 Tax=Pigmentibacter sp. JX0631 TaxID=2976982 RepID=UPI00246956BE|nr:Smr/MutS family protein [Pigmentibacter sp. JX0631]WGL59485.1 Smr/MutS family protein [Pigmentibacter sp. JX0631]
MEHENNIEHNSLSYLHKDALSRLEWGKITSFLAELASFPHTKNALATLDPWLTKEKREFYFGTTGEMLELNSTSNGLNLEPFDFQLFENSLKRGAILPPLALFQILTTLKLTANVLHFFKHEKAKSLKYPLLSNLALLLKPNLDLFNKLKQSVDQQGSILSTASAELQSARSRVEHAKRKIVEHLEDILKKQEIKSSLQDSVWMLRDGRYVLPVRSDRKSGVEGIPRGVSQSGSTVFIEPQALAAQHAQLEKAQTDVEIEENRILRELSKDCYLNQEDILFNAEHLTTFDFIIARTKLAGLIHGVEPKFVTNSSKSPRFSFLRAKHPLFILEKKPCIDNDLELKPKLNSNSPFIWVLSGPNAGGKTVAMKTVGILTLMAKAGLFVSCEKAELLDYEHIFVELGDRQNREEDLSTFSGHLAQLKKIATYSNEKTLILLDEGFVGTDPAIGVAMARSTLEFFAKKNSTVIITTHFSNLKTLADGDERFYNGSMEFEPKKLLPTYKLLNGIPGQSYAIELAERMGLNNEIIHQARNYYGNESQRMENILKDLQLKKIQASEELTKQSLLTRKLDEQLKSLQIEKEKISEIREDLVENYRNKLQKRLNAFENRLNIRERQFEKQKESLLKDLQDKVSIEHEENPSTIENSNILKSEKATAEDNKETKQGMKPKKLSGFEALSQLKLPKKQSQSDSYIDYDSLDDKASKFRAPKQMSSRALLDEARLSLNYIKHSYDNIEEELNTDLNLIQNSEKNTKDKVKQAKETVLDIKTQGKEPNFWQVGMTVKCDRFKEKGKVIKIVDSKGNVECLFGILKIKIPYYELKTTEINNQQTIANSTNKIKNQTVKKAKNTNLFDPEIPPALQHSGNTIDLRGLTVDIALDKLDLELDKMHRNEVEQVIIIHGHGMGRVKESVRKFIEETSYKLRYRNGRQGEGGDGVTVIEFIS